jgi:hypothetical protein
VRVDVDGREEPFARQLGREPASAVSSHPTTKGGIIGRGELEKRRLHPSLARDLGCERCRGDEAAQIYAAVAAGTVAGGREPLRCFLVEHDGERAHGLHETGHDPGAFCVEGDGSREVEAVELEGFEVVAKVARVNTVEDVGKLDDIEEPPSVGAAVRVALTGELPA